MKYALIVSIIATLSFHQSTFGQDSETKKKLTGSWIYDGLEGGLSPEKRKEADSMNHGFIITFKENGRFQVWKKVHGKKQVIVSGETKLSNNDKHIKVDELEGDIFLLNGKFLKIHNEDKPLLVFARYLGD